MFRIVLRFKSQNVMLFYTWPFNPRPPLFKGGLCLPLLKVPKRCRPETILLRYCARRTRASPKIEKCAESGAMPENLAKVALRHQSGSFPLPCLCRSLKLRAPLLAELSAKAALVQARAFGRKDCGAARREKLRTAMQTAHPHRKRTNAPAFKLRRQNAPPDDMNNARTTSTQTTAARPVKISRATVFKTKKYRRAL